jgi:hypothetical protein
LRFRRPSSRYRGVSLPGLAASSRR